MARELKIGDHVVWHDSKGNPHNALVICNFGQTGRPAEEGCINVVMASPDENEDDTYGRQIRRETSQVHKSRQNAHGGYWRFPEEEPNPYVAPIAK